ncbi:MAG: tetratricopeptide repeat protein [Anaerolineae bacterium]|jgi:tetratricopeptide (TPR) repeat protein
MSDKTRSDSQRPKGHIEEEATEFHQADVSDDVTAGDEISIGDIATSQGIAIGRYARAIVNNVSVALGIPAWGIIGAALILAFGLMLAAVVSVRPEILPRAPTPVAFAPAQPDETLVIVTQFEDRSQGQKSGIDPAQRIYQALLNDLAGRSSEIRVELYPEWVGSSEEARALGSTYNATLVLWGWYDRMGITPIAEVIQAEDTESFFGPELDISVDERFALCVRELPVHSSFLSLFTLGQAFFLKPGGRSSDEALGLFTAAIEEAPQASQCVVEGMTHQPVALSWASYYRGGVYYYRGQLDQALAEVSKAIQLDPGYGRAYRGLGTIYRALDDLAQAEAAYTKGLELERDNKDKAILYTNRGQVYAENDDLGSALSDMNQALRLDPTYARGYASRCKAYRLMHELDAALADCNQALELSPNYAWAYNERGLVYEAADEVKKALADYEKSTELDPDYAWPHNNQGVVLAKMDRLDEALERFSRAIALFSDPEDQAVAYSNRCNAYRLMEDFDGALADCERATELDPTNVSAYDRRVLIYRESKDYDGMMDDLSVAIGLEPTAGRYQKRAWVYSETGNYQAAITDYETAIELDPGDAAAYNSLAWLYADTLETNLERALELAQRAVELQPENPHNLDTLAWTYYKLGQNQEALDIYDKTIERIPEKEPYLYRGRGYVKAELGEAAGAVADLEMYLQLAPGAGDRGDVEALISELRGE